MVVTVETEKREEGEDLSPLFNKLSDIEHYEWEVNGRILLLKFVIKGKNM